MVEGPGATRNGRKVQGLVGLVLTEISSHQTFTGESSGEITKRLVMEGRVLQSAFSVGKEVFLVFGPVLSKFGNSEEKENLSERNDEQFTSNSNEKEIALRLHFGMNGVLTVRKFGESPKLAPWRKNDTSSPKLTIKFKQRISSTFDAMDSHSDITRSGASMNNSATMIIETVATTCTTVSAFVARSKFERLHRRDVCSDSSEFDQGAVLQAIMEKRKTSMVCDALLDQERYPGVGNIIKIEGLHKAKVHPRRLVEQLSTDELQLVILECRNYAMGWLLSGRAPTKQVYNRTKCGTCKSGRVRMVKLGRDLSRVTFWCEDCQPVGGQKSTKNVLAKDMTKKAIFENRPSDECLPIKACPQHGLKTTLLRRSRKAGSPNMYRLFRTCKVKGCPFFAWADSHLPSCRCRHKKAILRVSKTERTGGRWFLSCGSTGGSKSENRSATCSKPSNGLCSFFQWATPSHLAPFGDSLSPLT